MNQEKRPPTHQSSDILTFPPVTTSFIVAKQDRFILHEQKIVVLIGHQCVLIASQSAKNESNSTKMSGCIMKTTLAYQI